MRNINEYLSTKVKTQRYDDPSLFDKNYDDIYELEHDLNLYFGERLKKPIKVVTTDVVFKPTSPYSKDGIYVKDHFMIELEKSGTKLRFGYHKNYGLMMQEMWKDYKGKTSVGTLTQNNAYKYGTNFLDWLKTLQKDGHKWKAALELFKIEDK